MKLLKGSRFWIITPWFVLLSAIMAWKFDDPSIFTSITVVWMGGAGAKTSVGEWKNGAPTDMGQDTPSLEEK